MFSLSSSSSSSAFIQLDAQLYEPLSHWVLSIFTYNIYSRFSFPRPPCCAFCGPTSSTSTNEHGWPSSSSSTAWSATTFSRGTPTSSPSSSAPGRRVSRGRDSCINRTGSYARWSKTAPRSKGETLIYLCGFDVLMTLLQVTQYISGLCLTNLTNTQSLLFVDIWSNFGLSSPPAGRQLFRRQKRCKPNKWRERRTDGGDECSVGTKVRAINRENHKTILALTSCSHSRHIWLVKSLINVQFRSYHCLLSLHKSQLSKLMDLKEIPCSYLRLLLSPRRKAASEKPEDGQNVSEYKIAMSDLQW